MKSIAVIIALVIVLGAMLPLTTQVAAAAPSTPDKGAKKNLKMEEAKELTLQLLRLSKQYKNAPEENKVALLDQLVGLAMKREQALVSLVRDGGEGSGPAGFLNVVLSNTIRQDLPKESQKYLEQEVAVNGLLTVLHSDDFANGKSEHLYFLTDKKNSKKLEVHFADKEREQFLHSNAEVRVYGVMIADQDLAVSEEPGNFEFIAPAPEQIEAGVSTTAATSNKKIAVILFNFKDNKIEQYTKDFARQVTFTGAQSVNAYYQEVSFGKLGLQGHLRPDGDIFGWYTVPYDSSIYCPYLDTTASNAAAQMAQADGFNVHNYDKVIYGFPWSSGCPGYPGWAIIGGNEAWIHGPYFDLRVVSHELGHTFGLHHASSIDCIAGNGVRVSISDSCTSDEYGDPFDAMGGGYYGVHHLSTYHKGKLNFYNPSNTLDVLSSGSYTLMPIEESSTGVQALRIPRGSDPYGSPIYYYLEYRKPLGFDNFALDHPVVNGISVRIAPTYPMVTQTLLVDATPNTHTFGDATIRMGSTFSDPYMGITIKTAAIAPDSATVNVHFGSGACLRAQPELSISPAAQWGRPGDSLTYTIYITNLDSPECPDSTFSATPTLPSASGWYQSPAKPSITLSPGTGGAITVGITSSQDSQDGFYTFTETAVNDNSPAFSATASATYNVEVSDTTPPSITAPQTAIIEAASGQQLTNLCENLGISQVSASGNDGNVPANVNDNSLSTRWSNLGKGSWITVELAEKKVVCNMDIAWYKGSERITYFVISGSTDGTTFKSLYSGKSSGTTTQSERYEFADSVVKFVRLTVNGNSQNNWASITEIDAAGYTTLGLPVVTDNVDTMPLVQNDAPSKGFAVGTTTITWTAVDESGNAASATQDVVVTQESNPSFTITAPPPVTLKSSGATTTNLCQDLQVSGIAAKGNDGNVPSNVLDNSLSTRWSNLGKGSWITMDLGQSKAVCNVDIAWYKGNERSTNFVISVSIDGVVFKDVYEGKSTGKTTQLERYGFADSIARYIKVTVNGNSQNNWASITEIDAAGYVSLGLPTVSGTSDTSPLIYNNVPADGLPAGTTTIAWTAVDAAGNTAYATQEVKIANS